MRLTTHSYRIVFRGGGVNGYAFQHQRRRPAVTLPLFVAGFLPLFMLISRRFLLLEKYE